MTISGSYLGKHTNDGDGDKVPVENAISLTAILQSSSTSFATGAKPAAQVTKPAGRSLLCQCSHVANMGLVHVEDDIQCLKYEPGPWMRGVYQEIVLMHLFSGKRS
jgi:hypothetical protein